MRLIELRIQNVRGLPELSLHLDGKNVVILGPNGSGKSCVVDAIDFLFTGKISRLSGEGTGGITLSRHGPHIDHATESAIVTATVQLEGLSDPVELSRCMANPDEMNCPDEARGPLNKVVDLMRRGGVILTRRDILRYVTAEAKKRADEIQELLRLKNIEEARSSLVKSRTRMQQKKKAAQDAIKTAESDVMASLGAERYSKRKLLKQVNESRQALSGQPLEQPISERFKEGITAPVTQEQGTPSINSTLLQHTIQNVRRLTLMKSNSVIIDIDKKLRADITRLVSNPKLLHELARLELTEGAARFVEESTVECPVCGADWPKGHLKAHLEKRITTAKDAHSARQEIHKTAEKLALQVRNLQSNVNELKKSTAVSKLGVNDEDRQAVHAWINGLNDLLDALTNPVEKYLDWGFSTDAVGRLLAPEELTGMLQRIEIAVEMTLPKSTPEQTAWDKLTQLGVSVKALENRSRESNATRLNYKRAQILLSEYEKARDQVLGGLYSRVTNRFVDFYKSLHSHEVNHFDAKLHPRRASVTFEVDFMGRGTHPPHALHSEGHQDSMGFCLFLALNEELAKQQVSLIVLDDVVMSVDTGHRKEICRLINEYFPDSQFVITTHDRTWAKQLRQERVVEPRRVVEFTGWTVERGPNTHWQLDMWEKIQANLDQDDVSDAAFQLRRGSEDFFERVCDALGAKITYNSAMQWQLDDWLFPAMSQLKELLKEARIVAKSWGDDDGVTDIQELESLRKQIYDRTHVEQWAINASVHFNSWENLSREDFTPVVDAFRDLHDFHTCFDCGGLLEKLPRKGTSQVLKCPCGKTNLNLRRKRGNN